MKYRHFILFALVGYGACQDEVSEERIRPTFSSSGPNVTISLEWDRIFCGGIRVWSHPVVLCSEQNECDERAAYYMVSAKFPPNRVFPQLFFNTYTATVYYDCWPRTRQIWSRRKIFTGPGELMPPGGVAATGGNQNVTLTWQKPVDGVSVAGSYLEIKVCHKLTGVCLDTHQSDYGLFQGNFTIAKLSAGAEYIASVSVCKEYSGTIYRSKPVTIAFVTDPPEVRVYPPVNDLTVRLINKSKDVDLEINYTKPTGPPGAEFIGVRIDIVDKAESSVVEGLRSNDTTIKVENLPYFAHFTVKVKALYEDFEDVIESAEVTKVIGTGTDVLPDKPQILEVISISNSSALIRWSHTAHKSTEFTYRVVLNDTVTLDIESLNANHTVIDKGLEPDEVYNVKFSVLLSYHENLTEIASEEKQFRMLPADALVPKFSVEDIQGHFIHLKWDVTLPEGNAKCYLSVNHCQEAKSCTRTIISNMTDKAAHLEIEPFKKYNITMTTTCMFVPDISVLGVSETLNVLAASRPPAVSKLYGDSTDENTLNIFWSPGPPYTKGYKVNYTVASENSWKELNTSKHHCVISGLEPSTSYNVSVLAYSMNGDEVLPGPPISELFVTANHVPPKVQDVVVTQVPFTKTIKVNWKAPLYDKGRLSFKVTAKCLAFLELWTNETSLEFTFQEAPGKSTYCAIWVQSVNLGLHEPAYSEGVHAARDLQTIPPPVAAEGVFQADGKYLIKITPPKVEGVKDFEYEVSSVHEFSDRYQTNEIEVGEDRYDSEVSYAVRVCVNDLCSQSFNFSFPTNTGPPDRVSSMSLELIEDFIIGIKWSKPERGNGPIDGYFVNITEKWGQGQVHSFQEGSTDLSFEFDADEYKTYDVSVQAFNYDKWNRAVLKLGEAETQSIETEGTVPRPPSGVSSTVARGQKFIEWQADKKMHVACYKITATEVATQNQTILYRTRPAFELSVLKPYTQYALKISGCIDAAGYVCGQPSIFEETTDVGRPSPPHVQMVNRNATHVLVRWSEPEKPLGPINGYEVAYIKKADGRSPSNWISTRSERSAAFEGLDENTVYTFHVRAYNLDAGNKKRYSTVGVQEATTQAARGDVSTAAVAAYVCMGVVGLGGLAFVGYRKFGQNVFKTLRK